MKPYPSLELRRYWRLAMFVLIAGFSAGLSACSPYGAENRHRVPLDRAALARLSQMGSSAAAPMLIRIFKKTSELEVWKRTADGTYGLFKTYDICTWSGELGPKIKEGDRQAPEGFYTVTPDMMNPKSGLYLSFNTGFPNKFDRSYDRTGTNLMVHGDCSSAGCYAMTDEQIKEIYALARESFAAGNASFELQMYPFRMTTANLAEYRSNPNFSFWTNLKEGFDVFEKRKVPAVWDVCDRKYVFDFPNPSGKTLDARAACPPVPAAPVLSAGARR